MIELTYLETDEKFDIHVDCIRRLRETQELGSNLKVTVLITEDNSKNKRQADRSNAGKRKWSLVDFESLEPMVDALEYGAKKYAPFNYQKGHPILEVCESLLRHTFSFMSGEDLDPESGVSHIGCIQVNAMFLSYNMKHNPHFDDRRNREKKE